MEGRQDGDGESIGKLGCSVTEAEWWESGGDGSDFWPIFWCLYVGRELLITVNPASPPLATLF